jgi:hypothetical protein
MNSLLASLDYTAWNLCPSDLARVEMADFVELSHLNIRDDTGNSAAPSQQSLGAVEPTPFHNCACLALNNSM